MQISWRTSTRRALTRVDARGLNGPLRYTDATTVGVSNKWIVHLLA